MKKITIYFALLLLLVSIGVSAQEPATMHVHQSGNKTQSTELVIIQHITFEGNKMVLATSEGTFRFLLNDVESITFGEGTTAVENVEANTTRIYKSGNQLMIESEYAMKALYMVDMTGKVLVSQQLSSASEVTIDIPHAGVFVLFLETMQGYVAHKIIMN